MTTVQPASARTAASSRAVASTVAALVLAVTGFTASVAAANRFAVVGIQNDTHVTIRMHHKWGDGSWTTDVLSPGGRKWYWQAYEHANENRSPTFHVRFDSDLNPGKLFTIDYDLKKNAAPAHEWENAHKYAFTYDGNTKYIDLHER